PPEEFRIIREFLWDHYHELVPRLWALLEHEGDPERRLRAALALAFYDSGHPNWAALSDEIAGHLVTENPLLAERWFSYVGPARVNLRKSLIRIVRDAARPEAERSLATELLLRSTLLNDASSALPFDLFLDTSGRPHDLLLPWILGHPQVV